MAVHIAWSLLASKANVKGDFNIRQLTLPIIVPGCLITIGALQDRCSIASLLHWKPRFEGLAKRKGRSKSVVAIARMLLVTAWHILTKAEADCHADPQQVATSLFTLAHRIYARNLPDGQSALQFTRNQLDRLDIGQEITHIPWGSKRFKLPPSQTAG